MLYSLKQIATKISLGVSHRLEHAAFQSLVQGFKAPYQTEVNRAKRVASFQSVTFLKY